jgi:ubiquitin carboxyl-terminal hydrolase 8
VIWPTCLGGNNTEPDLDRGTTDDRHFAGWMVYDSYAVTVHVGKGINGGIEDTMDRDGSG